GPGSPCVANIVSPCSSVGRPRWSRYQALSLAGSFALKKMPPTPRTRSMAGERTRPWTPLSTSSLWPIIVAMTTLRVCIDVPDVDRAVDFYRATFGFDSIQRDGFVELVGAPVPIDILPRAAGSRTAARANAERTYERHWTPVHVDFIVD